MACTRPAAPQAVAPASPPVVIAPVEPTPMRPPAAARTVEIRVAPAKVGEAWEVASDIEAQIELRIAGMSALKPPPQGPPTSPPTSPPGPVVAPPGQQTMRVSSTEHHTIVIETLATEGAHASKGRVEFVGKKKTQQTDGTSVPETVEPIWGKRYLVARSGAELDVRTLSGKAAPAGEVLAVREALPRFGEADPLVAAIPSRPIAIGETVEIEGASLKRMLGAAADAGFEIPVVGLQLRAIEGEGTATLARFAVTAAARASQASMEMRIDLTGELVVRVVDGRPLAISIAGPLSMRMPETAGMKAEGGGRVWLATKWTERADQGSTRSDVD